jgi:hypothetical protein
MKKRYFDLPQGWQLDDVARALRDAYPIHDGQHVTEHTVYYDTFDWRLFNKSLTVAYAPPHVRLYSLPDERFVSQTDTTTPPLRLRDLPLGNLRTRLEPILDVRALLPLFDLTSCCQHLQLVDKHDKTVLRLTVEQHTLGQNREATPLVSRVGLHAMLRQERAKAHAALVRQLHTRKYQDIMKRWETFLAAPCDAAPDAAPAASRPILKLARKRIQKKGRAVVDLGMSLRGSREDKALHALRIACKKLRYLLEFFNSLFPPDIFANFITSYRKVSL